MQILLEVVCYGVGRIFVMIFLPWYRVEPIERYDAHEARRWKWQGFSYLDGGRRVMRTEVVQLIGFVITVAAALMIATLRGS